MTNDLVKRLRAVGGLRHDGATRWYVNPDGSEAADRIETLEALLEQRDAFIVSKDLWFEFVDSAALAGEKKDV